MSINGRMVVERRRQPRWAACKGVEGRLDLRARVQVVDISATGTLLVTELALPIGTRGQLTSVIASGPFSAGIEIKRRAAVTPQRHSPALGALFTAMDDRSRQRLEEFLKKASA